MELVLIAHSIGMYYCALTELLGFKRLKDEGKIVGLAGHGEYIPDFIMFLKRFYY
jgi:predicted NodU family carbamoyl transferase